MLLASPEDDPEGPIHPRVVEEVFVRASPLLALRVCGREIRTTNEHPFYVQEKGWVKAWLLSPGDLLRTADGRWLPVESIADTGDVATVYNFRVAEYHTYYVGSPHWGFAVWSHNSNCARGAGVPGDDAPKGVWARVKEAMSARAAAYQAQITGRTGQAYIVNGTKFDGFDNGVLTEAKGPGYATFVRNGRFRRWFRGAGGMVEQAQRQLAAANGAPITWHVAEQKAVTAIQNLFKTWNISGINVVHTPVIP